MGKALILARKTASDITLVDAARVAITGGCALALALAGALVPAI